MLFPGIGSHGKFSGRVHGFFGKFDIFRKCLKKFWMIFPIFGRTLIYMWYCSNSICQSCHPPGFFFVCNYMYGTSDVARSGF